MLNDETELLLCSFSFDNDLFALRFRGVADDTLWLVKCGGVVDWQIRGRFAEGLGISISDPRLWRYNFAIYNTYFCGYPTDPYRASCELLGALPYGATLRTTDAGSLADLLKSGNGSFGTIPVPAIKKCREALAPHGIELYSLPGDLSTSQVEYSLLTFGDESYVVGETFDAERVEHD